jgi:Zn-finger nucleic acid-binding protein
MQGANGGVIQLELKYCERCGGLWLRPRGSEVVFCNRCSRTTASLFPGQDETARFDRESAYQGKGDERAFWVEGGNA